MITAPTFPACMQLNCMHHLADPEHLHTSLPLHHHLNDDHQLQIALLASSVTIELVASSSRVTSAKFQPKVLYSYRDTRTGQDQGHLGPPDSGKKVTDFYITLV